MAALSVRKKIMSVARLPTNPYSTINCNTLCESVDRCHKHSNMTTIEWHKQAMLLKWHANHFHLNEDDVRF